MSPKKRPPQRKHPPIILVTGASGAGKSSVVDLLLADKHLPIVRFVTCTTRPKRPGERNGKDYWFMTPEKFRSRLAAHGFYEHANVYDRYYGSSKAEMARLLKGRKAIVMILDVKGTRTMKRFHPEATAIFIDAPTASLRTRLKKRGADMNDLKRRLVEIATEKRFKPKADIIIVNRDGELKRTVTRVKTLIRNALRKT
jgi:guanylate kinase